MQTSQGDDDIRRKLEFSNVVNFEYMEQKWGPWWRTCWPWDGGPFDNKDLPLSHTTYDLQFVRKPEDATLILNREQKSKLFNAISILGRRRTQILEGLNFTLNQLKLNNEEETV